MLRKGNKLYSIFYGKCPQCHESNMYVNKNAYQYNTMLSMHEKCGHCGLKYQIEPSFFYGAMYVSYAVTVAFGVAAFVISHLFFGSSLKVSFVAIIASIVVFYPIILRLSRNIWINMFVNFKNKQ